MPAVGREPVFLHVIAEGEGHVPLGKHGNAQRPLQRVRHRKLLHKGDVRRLYDLCPLPVQRGGKTNGHGVKGEAFRRAFQESGQIPQHIPGAEHRGCGKLLKFHKAAVLPDNAEAEIGAADVNA